MWVYGCEGVQMHGGSGMNRLHLQWGLYVKRARVVAECWVITAYPHARKSRRIERRSRS